MRVLILTDKFPPNVVGGAEISLKATLDHIARSDADLHVVVLDQPTDADILEDTNREPFAVTRIAGLGQWPPTYPYPAKGAPALRGLRARLAWPLSAVRYLLTPNGRGLTKRFRRLQAFRHLTKAGMIHRMPSFDDDLAGSKRTQAQLKRVIDAFRPDLIHADNTRSILVASALKRCRPKRVAMVRDNRFLCSKRDQDTHINGQPCARCTFECMSSTEDDTKRASLGIMGEVARFRLTCLGTFDAILTTSAYLARQVSQLVPNKHIHRVPNPVLSEGSQAAGPSRDTYSPEILIVGMLNDNKGQARVIAWIQAISARIGFVRFVLAGRGQMAGRLQREAERAGVTDQLELAGFLDRQTLQVAYQRARFVLIPSVWPEPFGRVPLEAGLAGKAVLAYAVGGLTETIRDGETGFLVPPGDENALLERMIWMLEHPAEVVEMGRTARDHITRNYTAEASAQALVEGWRSAVGVAA